MDDGHGISGAGSPGHALGRSSTDDRLEAILVELRALRASQQAAQRQWLTLAEVALELSVSIDTVRRMIAYGSLRATRLISGAGTGRKQELRVHRNWLDESLEQSEVRTAEAEKRASQRRKRIEGHDFIN